jgi:hypothetical protein
VFRVGFLVWGLDRLQVETLKDSKRLKKTQKDMKRHRKTMLDNLEIKKREFAGRTHRDPLEDAP